MWKTQYAQWSAVHPYKFGFLRGSSGASSIHESGVLSLPMAACGSGLSLSRKRPGPVETDVPDKRRLPGNPVTPPTARTSDTEVTWTVPHMQLPPPHMQLRHVDDDGDPAIGTSPFDHDGDYGFDTSDVFDQKAPVAPPTRLLDRYGAPTLDAEDVLDDAQPPKVFSRTAPLAFHADDDSDGEDSDEGSGSHAARALRKAEYSSDDDSGEEEEHDAEYDFDEVESDQSNSSDEDLDSEGSSSDDDDEDGEVEEQVFPTAWSDGDDE